MIIDVGFVNLFDKKRILVGKMPIGLPVLSYLSFDIYFF